MQEIYNTARKLWEIKLDDGFVISHATEHCKFTFSNGNFNIYNRFAHDNVFVAHDITTHQEYENRIDSGMGSKFKAIADSRYIALAWHTLQEKQYDRTDLLVIVFDKQTQAWKTWTQNNFYKIAVGWRNNAIWVKHGSGSSVAPLDPGQLRDYRWKSFGVIEWDRMDASSISRSINFETGAIT